MAVDDSDEVTPVASPQARRSSSAQRLGLVTCPKCKGDARVDCDLCNSGRMVAVDSAIAWTLAHGDTEPPTR
jgi:hypothetical protein